MEFTVARVAEEGSLEQVRFTRQADGVDPLGWILLGQ